MFDFIITALGGFTKRDHDNWEKIIESWRARCLASETTVELMKEIMTRERERSERLEERLSGPRIDLSQQKPPDMKPVGNSISSWPRIKRELEKEHRVNDAGVSREKIEKEIRS